MVISSLLTLAWWKQKLTGVTAQAIGLALLVALVVAVVVGVPWWLRADARADERSRWVSRVENARLQDLARLRLRERQAAEIARAGAAAHAIQLAASEAARERAEALLAGMKDVRIHPKTGRPVCWPREITKDLNR